MNYSTIPTVVGAAKLRNASLLGQKVDITRVAFGDGNGAGYEPTGQETELKKQVYECPPNHIEEEAGAPTWIELEAVIPHNVGGWYLREVGCFDDEGDLIFIGNLPSSFKPSGEAGVIKDLVFEMVYDAVAADVVQIKIDPNVVIATRKYVDDQDKAHTDAPDPHPQYATDDDLQAHLDADEPHQQYLKESEYNQDKSDRDSDLSKLPHYPEIMTANNQLDISLAGTTLTVADNQVIRLHGWKDFNTTDLQTKSFEIDLAKTYHLRFTEDNGLELKDLSDVGYNPASSLETDVGFDSNFGDVLLASVIAGSLTTLINKDDLYAVQVDTTKSRDWIHPEMSLTLNWARTPKYEQGYVIGLHAHALSSLLDWDDRSMSQDVVAFDALLVSLSRYQCTHKYRAVDNNSVGGESGLRVKQEVRA